MLIFAHRGASGYAPENTIPAFDLGLEMGADGLETDVQRTSDGALVLIHDALVDRTTDGNGPISQLAWRDVAALDAGSWLDPKWAGLRVPTLGTLLDRYLGKTILCLEAKAEDATLPLVDELVRRGITNRADVQLSSFSWSSVLQLAQRLPDLVVGYLTPRFDGAEIQKVLDAGLRQICPRADVLTPALVQRAHAAGLQVRAWGVSSRDDLQRVIDSGADGTTLNWPDWAR
ncbi:MAG: glycerophosphodiester phosphodiesterase family protein [Chloroflexota bacterium]